MPAGAGTKQRQRCTLNPLQTEANTVPTAGERQLRLGSEHALSPRSEYHGWIEIDIFFKLRITNQTLNYLLYEIL